MSNPKQSKKSFLLRPFKGLLSRPSPSPSPQGAQSVTTHNLNASTYISATLAPKVNPQGTSLPSPQTQSATSHNASAYISATSASQVNSPGTNLPSPRAQSVIPHNASASISAKSAPQVNLQGTEYTAILGSLTREHQMKEWGSTAYEGLKMAIQGIYDFSGSFPPLKTTAGLLLTIIKAVDVRGSICPM